MIIYKFRLREGRLEMTVEDRTTERSVATHYDIRENEWDHETGWIRFPEGNSARRRKLLNYERAMARDIRTMARIVNESNGRRVTVDEIVNSYRAAILGNQMFGAYASTLAKELKQQGQIRTARGYITTMRRFIGFNRGHDVRLDEMTLKTMDAFQNAIIEENIAMSTLSFYMRNLRAIYNKAIAERLITPSLENPFENAYVEIDTSNA